MTHGRHLLACVGICLFARAPVRSQRYTSERGGLSFRPSSPQTVNFNNMSKLARVSALSVFGPCQDGGGTRSGVGALQNRKCGWFNCHGNQIACGEGAGLVSWGGDAEEVLVCSCI